MRKKFSKLPMFLMPVLACGGGGADNKIVVVDATGSGKVFKDAPGSGSATCTASADYGTVTFGSGEQQELKYTAAEVESGSPNQEMDGLLNENANPDLVDLQLYAGYGGFGSGGAVRAGTYTISAVETNYATCGVCAQINTQVDLSTGDYVDTYFATGGTITLTMTGSGSANAGTLAGSFSNVTFTHVTISSTDGTTTPVGDNCNSKIDALSFSGVLMAPSTGSDAPPVVENPARFSGSALRRRWR